ncbi:polysaccharide deacetylase familiy protein [Catellatospora sp. TT07R-123]|uniref:polysaccharide deacetylase family protein n=1 Tax=Catellatospora sp. TT07R-123 TaxID=2733863 RepID=UPI001B029CB9|nr:polysaccharide deacetylase family protein [Catellatospora sp. TT07R-123]GHJ43406.1 polysaccharide deacetylase familiy protein [Catellatospora sp. TT07R-123]
MKGRVLTAATAAAAAVVGWHALPAVTSVAPVRVLTPRLAGRGHPSSVALTFDDGPHPLATPLLLDLLDRYQIKATFFLLGVEVLRAPEVAAAIAAAGHEVAVHGHTHRCLLARTPAATLDDIRLGRDIVTEATGATPTWYRPPYGVLTTAALTGATRLGLRPVLWTGWGRDWTSHATGESVYRTAVRNLRGGATLLLHDSDATSAPGSWRATLAALPRLIEFAQTRHLTFATLSAHGIDRVRAEPSGGVSVRHRPPSPR